MEQTSILTTAAATQVQGAYKASDNSFQLILHTVHTTIYVYGLACLLSKININKTPLVLLSPSIHPPRNN